jgi:hypothetical protein
LEKAFVSIRFMLRPCSLLQINGCRSFPVKVIPLGLKLTAAYGLGGAMNLDSYSSISPRKVEGLDGISQLSMGWTTDLALKQDGSMWVWGYNSYGEKGDGTVAEMPDFKPTPVASLGNVISMAGGGNLIIAVKEDGTVWAWGNLHHTRNGAV